MLRTLCIALAALASTAMSSPAFAVLDIDAAEAVRSTDSFRLIVSHVHTPDLPPRGSVTWGISRAAGTSRLGAGDMSVGTNVLFDAAMTIQPHGPTKLFVFNEVGPPTITEFDDATPFNDTLLAADFPHDLLPSRVYVLADYSFNARTRGGPGNTGIADFAPDSNFGVVPEPESWAMLIIGFGLVGGIDRRRLLSVST